MWDSEGERRIQTVLRTVEAFKWISCASVLDVKRRMEILIHDGVFCVNSQL